MSLKNTIKDRVNAAENYLNTKRVLWDEYENLFNNKLDSQITDTTKSQVFDPKLSTLAIERSNRVMSQMPMGKVKAISKNDDGASKIMNLILDKYIVPNANAQFDLMTKFRMVDLYSNIYGNYFSFIDWDIRKDGYVGPNLWNLNIRDVFPQVGAVSLNDSDFVCIRTWKPISFFENLRKQDGYKNIPKIIKKLEKSGGAKASRDANSITQREEDQFDAAVAAKNAGYHEVYSCYERDRWIDYVADADEVFRDGKNPHDNEKLPVVNKYSIPLMEDFMGMGDFERGKSMQKTINSIWNLYLDAVKISIFPPVLLNKDNIASTASIKWGPAAKWLGRNNIGNFAQTMNLTPQGISTFNNTYQVATAALLNQFGTTDTSTTPDTDPGFGKTPQALKMQDARENSRDNADRFQMEQYLKEVMDRFINLTSKKSTGSIVVRMFGDEITELAKSYPDIEEMYDENTGKLTMRKSDFGSVIYDYEMVSGSTYAEDNKSIQDNLLSILEMFIKNPNVIQQLEQQEGVKVKLSELITRIMANSNVKDWDKIVVDQDSNQNIDEVLQNHMQEFQAALAGGGQQQPVNGIPPQQNGPVQQQQPPAQQNFVR